MPPLVGIQQRLLTYKESNNLTYDELGKALGVSKGVAFDICTERRRFIELCTLDKILKLLGE